MNTVLVILALSGRVWHPQFVVEFPNEAACQVEAAKTPQGWLARTKAVCVPKVQSQQGADARAK